MSEDGGYLIPTGDDDLLTAMKAKMEQGVDNSEAELLSIIRGTDVKMGRDYYRCVFRIANENYVIVCYVGKELDDIPEFRDLIIEYCREEAVYVAQGGKEAT